MTRALSGRVVFYDLEMTAWEGSWQRRWSGPGEHREIVQIGAVAVDVDAGFAELASFETLVRPKINPVLSDYFIALTGIRNEDVAARGASFGEALARFTAFVGPPPVSLCSFGADDIVIRENCAIHGLPYPFDAVPIVNAAPIFCGPGGLDPKVAISSSLPDLMGFPAPGPKHQALYDARCVARGMRLLRERGVV